MTPISRIATTLLTTCALAALAACAGAPAAGTTAADAAAAAPPAAASAPARVRVLQPAPRTGPGGSTYGARHGGLVLSDQGVTVELDAQPGYLDLHLTEGDKPVDLKGATGHITLLNGVEITDAYLDPSPDRQRLTISGEYKLAHGTRIIVRVALADGRKLNLRYLIVNLPPPRPAASAVSRP
ncbi:MAG: hypothetical protein RLZZ584_1067 [Pseudomonadota bacterium]|jgi:hypothetical protein